MKIVSGGYIALSRDKKLGYSKIATIHLIFDEDRSILITVGFKYKRENYFLFLSTSKSEQ